MSPLSVDFVALKPSPAGEGLGEEKKQHVIQNFFFIS